MPEYDYVWSEWSVIVGHVGSLDPRLPKRPVKKKIDEIGGTGFRAPDECVCGEINTRHCPEHGG